MLFRSPIFTSVFNWFILGFTIQLDEITKDVSLIVTDFCPEDELEESKLLWDSLVADLKQVLGSA